MTEQSMVEKVARAIASSLGDDSSADLMGDGYVEMARAAIEAMREPTAKMYDAYVMALRPGPDGNLPKCSRREKMRRRWQAMLDEALKG